jgi:cell division protein FtsI/penicillin-binding protein 2
VSDSTWDLVFEGMRLVTQPGAGGTAVNVFRDFPINVAGKTGTAEQIRGRPYHTAFGGFAPLEDPQIAIYVSIPFGTLRAFPHMSTHIARDLIGEALGLNIEPQRPEPLNVLSR